MWSIALLTLLASSMFEAFLHQIGLQNFLECSQFLDSFGPLWQRINDGLCKFVGVG